MIQKKLNLDGPGNRSSFKVPEGYFEGLTAKMNELIDKTESENENQEVDSIDTRKSFILKYKPILYMAAMFVVLLFSLTAVLKFTGNGEKKQSGLMSTNTTDIKQVLTAEEYVISTVGTYAITEYYIDPEIFEE